MDRFFASLPQTVRGKTVVVTGASDGIGAHLAPRLAAAGARVLLVARTAEKLRAVRDSIRAAGGEAEEYVANLSEDEDCQRVVREILADRGYVEIIVSNAGRSIRRSAKYQGSDRFHDFQRLMALNFFGALRLILGLLPSMEERGSGHIVHVSSFGVPTRQPRFSGYCASKSALDAALQCMAGEVASSGISTSSVYMPLVQTKMVESKGHSYDHMKLLTVDMACDLIEHAIVTKQAEVTDGPSRFLALLYWVRPSLVVGLNSLYYRLERESPPDTALAPRSEPEEDRKMKKGGASRGSFSGLKFLGSLLAFFIRLEMFGTRIGLTWILRDPVIILILLLVLVVQPIVAGLLAIWRFGRRSACSRRLQASSRADRKRTAPCRDSGDVAAQGDLQGSPSEEVVGQRGGSDTCASRRAKAPRSTNQEALRTVLQSL